MSSNQSQTFLFDDSFFSHDSGTYIHPTAIIGSNVKIGSDVKIGPYCVVIGNVTIGSRTRLHAHVTIGFPAEVYNQRESLGSISIGSDCDIREFVTIHASKYPDGTTTVGNGCYIMNYCHISHDCYVGNNVILTNNAQLGGHTHLEDHVLIMANAATHQFCRIGKYSALAPYSGIRQDLPPFCIFSGQPAAFIRINLIKLRRSGFTIETCNALRAVTRAFYQEKYPLEKIKQLQEQEVWGGNSLVHDFLSFIDKSNRGVSRRLFSQNSQPEIKEDYTL